MADVADLRSLVESHGLRLTALETVEAVEAAEELVEEVSDDPPAPEAAADQTAESTSDDKPQRDRKKSSGHGMSRKWFG